VYSFFIIFVSLTFNELKRAARTITKTGTKSITIFIANDLCLAVNDLNGPFGTGGHAITTAITLFFVYFYDITDNFHGVFLSLDDQVFVKV
jgi:hypothetical protein